MRYSEDYEGPDTWDEYWDLHEPTGTPEQIAHQLETRPISKLSDRALDRLLKSEAAPAS